MANEKDPEEEKRLKAPEAELARLKARYETRQENLARLLKERDELAEAALWSAQNGKDFAAHYYDCMRRACEEGEIDAETLIGKLSPLTVDFLTDPGMERYTNKLRETLTDEEFRVCGRANAIALQSLWRGIRKRSSNV